MKKIYNLDYVRNVTVILGRRCNGKCVYCAQSGLSSVEDKLFNYDIINFIVELTRYERKDKYDKLQILLYGGEPLLYWEQLKRIVIGVYSAKSTIRENFYFKIFTNGVLLNEEIVDFLNKFKVKVVLAYDGPNEALRPVRLRDEQIPLFRKLEHRSVSFVVSTENNSIIQTMFFLKKKFGEDTDIDNSAVCAYYNGDKLISRYAPSNYRQYYKNFIAVLNYYEHHLVDSLFWHNVRGWFRTNSMIMQDRLDFLSIDISGNVYGFSDKEDSQIGTIYDDCRDHLLEYRKSQHFERCYDCKFNFFCRAYYGVKDDAGMAYNCKIMETYIGTLNNLQGRIIAILNRPENRDFIKKLDSNWKIEYRNLI